MPSLADYSFAIVDLETTGTNCSSDRITEVAIIEIESATVVDARSQLINPGTTIPPYIQGLTGITPDMVYMAPRFEAVADALLSRLEARILVAHNVRFDYGFLRNAFKRVDRCYRPRMLCTVKLSRLLNPARPTHKLDHLIDVYGLHCARRHRALDDAQLLWLLIKCWVEEHGVERVIEAIEAVLKTPSLPAGLTAADIEQLPQTPGVYLFYGIRDTLLYVGKSNNIRARVSAHFYADHAAGREQCLAQQVTRIEYRSTVGDLGAQLLESRLVKSRQPLYNRRLRKQDQLVYFVFTEDEGGFLRPVLHQSEQLPAQDGSAMVGFFKSTRAARDTLREWARRYGFCPRLLGLEKSRRGACLAYQLKKCRGACCGQESATRYNERLHSAIASRTLKPWPFTGAAILAEHGHGLTDYHLVDQWCYLGTRQDPAHFSQSKHDAGAAFDFDNYKLLVKALARCDTTVRQQAAAASAKPYHLLYLS